MRVTDREPVRLRHELGTALEHALLSAGASGVSSDETRTKTMAALGLASSATLLAGIAAGSLGPAAKAGMAGWAKLLVGVSALSAATAVPVGYLYVQQQKAAAAMEVAVSRRAPARPVAASVEIVRPIAAPVAPVVPRSTRPSLAPRGALTKELAALDGARTSLVAGDARGALAALDTYNQTYPSGQLELEAEVLRIEAVAKSGRAELARDRGHAFLRRYPQSVFTERVRAQLRAVE